MMMSFRLLVLGLNTTLLTVRHLDREKEEQTDYTSAYLDTILDFVVGAIVSLVFVFFLWLIGSAFVFDSGSVWYMLFLCQITIGGIIIILLLIISLVIAWLCGFIIDLGAFLRGR
jgi:hypothetical protein